MLDFYASDSLLQRMFDEKPITQSVFSRFLVSEFQWGLFNLKRLAKFQEYEETRLADGDVIALDDSLVTHNYAEKMPFIYRLWDHCSNTYVDAMNLVTLHAVKNTGLQYPLLYSIWQQDNGKDPHQTKLDLALELLSHLKNQISDSLKLWVAMDSWYFVKEFCLDVEQLGFNWVSKARKNTTLYRKTTINGKERFVQILPEKLFKEARPAFTFWRKKGTMCMKFNDIYLVVDEIHHGKGYKKEPIFIPVNAVVIANLMEDQEIEKENMVFALLLSNNTVAKPQEIVQIYKKRWSIEIFFRNAKQELGLNDCHSTDENHIHAHLSLLFIAESLVRFAQWKFNNEKTGTNEEVSHGQVVTLLLHTRCEVIANGKDSTQIYFDITSKRFASFFIKLWPNKITMNWFDFQQYWNYYPLSG